MGGSLPLGGLAELDGRLLALAVAACGAAGAWRSAYGRGWRQTLVSTLSIHCNRASFATRHCVEEFACKDGELGIVWWPLPHAASDASTTLEETLLQPPPRQASSAHLWVVLPGGMCNAAAGYVDDAVSSGVFDGCDWCAFHNPGIEVRTTPPALIDQAARALLFSSTQCGQLLWDFALAYLRPERWSGLARCSDAGAVRISEPCGQSRVSVGPDGGWLPRGANQTNAVLLPGRV